MRAAGGAGPRGPAPVAGGLWAGLLLAGLLSQTVVGLVRPMASYRALELDVAPAMLGAVAAGYAVLPLVAALPAGRRSDRRGGVPVARVGLVVEAVAACWLPFVGSLTGLLAATALLGLGHLLALVGMQAVIAQGHGPGGRVGGPGSGHDAALDRYYGWFSMTASAGQVLGPVLAGLLAGAGGAGGTTRALVGGAVVSAASLLALPLLRLRRPAPAHATADPPPTVPVRTILRAPGVTPAMVVSLGVLAATDVLTVYLPALGAERGWSPQQVGTLLALRATGSIASRFLLGRLAAWAGRERLLLASTSAAAAGVVWLALADPLLVAAVAITLAGFALGVGQPLSMAVVAGLSPPGSRATALSVRLLGNRLGQVLIPAAAGAVAAATATTGVLVTAGVVVAASGACVAPALRRRRPPRG